MNRRAAFYGVGGGGAALPSYHWICLILKVTLV